jgi:hypothetical protein
MQKVTPPFVLDGTTFTYNLHIQPSHTTTHSCLLSSLCHPLQFALKRPELADRDSKVHAHVPC